MRRGFRSEPQIGVVFSLSISLFLSLLLWQTRTSRCCTKHTRELCGNINERIISKFSRLDTWQLSTVLEGIDEIHIVRNCYWMVDFIYRTEFIRMTSRNREFTNVSPNMIHVDVSILTRKRDEFMFCDFWVHIFIEWLRVDEILRWRFIKWKYSIPVLSEFTLFFYIIIRDNRKSRVWRATVENVVHLRVNFNERTRWIIISHSSTTAKNQSCIPRAESRKTGTISLIVVY